VRSLLKIRKKTKMILTLLLVVTIGIGSYEVYKYTHKEKPHEFQTDVEREEYINEFSKLQGEDKGVEIVENAGGASDINILNRGEILKVEKNIDIMLSTDVKVSDGIAVLDTLYKDIEKKSDNEIISYYYESKDQLSPIYGITNEEDFKKFSKTLTFLEGTKIISANIGEGTLKKVGNIIDFDLVLKTYNNKTQTYKMRVIITVIEGKKGEVLIYWK
jgi:hypothetical protein